MRGTSGFHETRFKKNVAKIKMKEFSLKCVVLQIKKFNQWSDKCTHLMCELSAFSSLSKARVEPHLATWARPFEAMPPYSQTLKKGRKK
jgi:hypothetical protein